MERRVKENIKLDMQTQSLTDLQPEAMEVLGMIRPTGRTFLCRRTGCLVDGGFCAFFCDLTGREREVNFDPCRGIEVFCPFRYHDDWNGMGEAALADA